MVCEINVFQAKTFIFNILHLSLKYSKISQLVNKNFFRIRTLNKHYTYKNWNKETVFTKSTCIVNLAAYDLAIFYPNN